MADSFYPFVENGRTQSEPDGSPLVVCHPARIAVYDDAAAAPRVVIVEPNDIRSYLEEITATVAKLAQDQGGKIPFTVIREVVENLIHAYFIEPTISILDQGNTIRFSDQGPGIKDKDRALEYGTTSATNEMKRYIRGVGSGLPYVQQWLEDKGGSLSIEDNIHNGTVVTVTLKSNDTPAEQPFSQEINHSPYQQEQTQTPTAWQQAPSYNTGMPQAQGTWPAQQTYQQPYPPQQGWSAPVQGYPTYQQGYGQAAYPQPWQGTPYPYPQQGFQQPQPFATTPVQNPSSPTTITVSERGMFALQYLMNHESVGPRDLNAIQHLSEATWSRELSQLESQGLISKQGGQKRKLTQLGRQFLGL